MSILSLKDRWPALTENEKKEIEASAYAIYFLDRDVSDNGLLDNVEFPRCLELLQTEEDYNNEENEDYDSNTQYNISSSKYNYSTYDQPVQKKKSFFERILGPKRNC